MREYQAAYRTANAEARQDWFRANADRMREHTAAWSRENRDKRNAANALRHATKLRATPKWADAGAIARIYADAAVKSAATGVPYEVDHIVPLISKQVCGLHCQANLQLLTAAQNQSKQNRFWPDMFPAEVFDNSLA